MNEPLSRTIVGPESVLSASCCANWST